MNQEELNRFLASVRRTRFVDYLDPIGETAHEALERRLKWAARSRNDPAHADEADFLLRNEAALRDLVTEELVDGGDDWVESADAGSEWGHGWGAGPSTTSSAPARSGGGRMAPEPEPEPEPDPDFERTGIMRMEDLTNPPIPPRAEAPGPQVKGTPTYSPTRHDDDDELPEDLVRDIWNRNAPEGAKYTPAPASSLVEHEIYEGAGLPASSAPFSRASTPAPVSRSALRPVTPGKEDEVERTALDIRASRSGAAPKRARGAAPRPNRLRAVVFLGLLGSAGVVAAMFVGVLQVPGSVVDQVAGMIGLERGEEVAVEAAEPEPVVEEPDAALAEADALTEGEATDAVADTDAEGAEGAGEEGAEGEGEGDVVADAGGAEQPAPVAAAPKPAPATKPAAPKPAAPKPAAPKPAPAPEPAAPKPAPAPAPVAAAPKPAPAPAPEPAVAEAPDHDTVVAELPEEVSYPTLTGMWVGLAASKSFQLKIDSQNGGSFAGTAEVMNDAGEWDKLQIIGTIQPDGALKFSEMGGGASFSGSLDGIRASGTVKLSSDAASEKWSVIK